MNAALIGDAALASATAALALYILVTMAWWSWITRRYSSELQPLFISIVFVKIGIFTWAASNVVGAIIYHISTSDLSLPARIMIVLGAARQACVIYRTTRRNGGPPTEASP